MDVPDISVVVPTYRRPQLVDRCLTSLAKQDSSRFEVIVVDDGSGDATAAVLEEWVVRFSELRVFTQPENRGPAAARNRGIQEARASRILFLDDDIVAPEDLVTRHLEAHAAIEDGDVGVLGRVDWEPGLRVTPFMRWLDRSGLQFAYETWLQPGPVHPPYGAFYTCNLSMSRDLLVAAGGFDQRFPYPAYEDIEIAYRLTDRGFRLVYVPEALAFHSRSIDLATFRERMRKVAESAEILSTVQRDFPIDHRPAQQGWVRRRQRLLLQVAAPAARALGLDGILARHYRAQIAAAYQEGRSRGRERLGRSAT